MQKLQKLQSEKEHTPWILWFSLTQTTHCTAKYKYKKYTRIENLKLPRRSYRNYRVKRNAYIEILTCWVSHPAETTETTGWKRAYPMKLFDSPWLKLCTYIENLKAPLLNYRNYKVKWNACIENLNCWESLPLETTETTGYKWTYPPEFSDFHWLRLHTT